MPKKYYAVARGRHIGIYYNWSDAKKEVEGFAGAKFKSFSTEEEAMEWIKSINNEKTAEPPIKKEQTEDKITIYTDGCSLGNPGPGGYGVVYIHDNGMIEEKSAGYRLTTNNRMELMAVIEALKGIELKDKPIIIYSDSSYVVNAITKGWANTWEKNNWIKSDKKLAENIDLWEELLKLIKPLQIEFKWIRGHAGNKYNEKCDELAKLAAESKNLLVDEGYTKKYF